MMAVIVQLFRHMHARRIQKALDRDRRSVIDPTDTPLVARVLHPVYHLETECPIGDQSEDCAWCVPVWRVK